MKKIVFWFSGILLSLVFALTITLNVSYSQNAPDTVNQGNTYNLSLMNNYNIIQGGRSNINQK